MYHTILVPLDGSKRAERILKHVEKMAQRYSAKVIFLQVVSSSHIIGRGESFDMELYQKELRQRTKQAESYLASLKGEFREEKIEARTRVVHGPVVQSIIDMAEREGADLVAISSHGRSGLSRLKHCNFFSCIDQ